MRRTIAFGGVIALLCALPVQAEDTCPPLHAMTTVDMTLTKGGQLRIPVGVGEEQRSMILDTGAAITALWPEAVDALGLKQIHTGKQISDVLGNTSDMLALLPAFSIGRLKTADQKVFIFPGRTGANSEDKHLPGSLIGLFGADFLRMYDVDVDFGRGKVRLVSQNHCPGQVVYWNPKVFAEIPMRIGPGGHILLSVTLDGEPVRAVLDTGASRSTLEGPFAERRYGLSAASGKVGVVNNEVVAGIFRHRFKTLDLNGVVIANPVITVSPDVASTKRSVEENWYRSMHDANGHDMLLGIDVLRHLHLYIDYKDKKIFVSAADDYGQEAQTAPAKAP